MEDNEENINIDLEKKEEEIKEEIKEDLTIKIINNEVDNLGEIIPNMEFNIMVIGKEGKYIYLFYICRSWETNII